MTMEERRRRVDQLSDALMEASGEFVEKWGDIGPEEVGNLPAEARDEWQMMEVLQAKALEAAEELGIDTEDLNEDPIIDVVLGEDEFGS